ncbi:MAG: D-alanyl-D-alanine carboxypeptidase [Chthoniobacterales bacterium]|nr:D-alanyl-D-alanine carboxypeptidase [Chthoniobacterales bacterium]MCX7712149.1 D-alanyl-D-alanine carboxypeptidase [Chthoniobacterales bacterium]
MIRLLHFLIAIAVLFSTADNLHAQKKKKKISQKTSTASLIHKSPPPPIVNFDSAGRPILECRSAILFDARTGRVLFRKNENEIMPVASTQKLLTALLVAERGNLDGFVVIQPEDTLAEPTKLGLRPGERYTRRQLLNALLIRSANDVALALARDHSGSIEAFAQAMNRRIRQLGGTVSNFVNPNGLPDERQFSTAREMALVARAAYFNRDLRPIMATREYIFRRNNGSEIFLTNTNRVLRSMPECNGMKTGYTIASGHCLISSAQRNGRHVIAIVLGSNKRRVWPESQALLEYGLERASAPAPAPTSSLPSLNILNKNT